MHIISADDFSTKFIDILFEHANKIKFCPEQWRSELKGKIIANVFYEESTRTRLSFEAAMYKLGGKVLTYFPENSSEKKGESNQDSIRTISQYVDALVIRHPNKDFFTECKEYSEVPIISAGNGHDEHPTQALLDLYTIKQLKPEKELKIMFTGDLVFSRTIHSFVKIIQHSDLDVKFIYTLGAYEDRVANLATFTLNAPNEHTVFEGEIPELLPEIDVLYMTRKQTERWRHFPSFFIPSKFILTPELIETMKSDAIIMHPLPRREELPTEVDDNPRAVYFTQAKFGLYVRMALLWYFLRSD